MLNIDENQLKLLLEKKRKMLEQKKYDGIGESISSISLMITLVLSDFSQLTIIKPLYFKIIAWGCKLRSNGMPVPLLRNCYSIFNGTKYR